MARLPDPYQTVRRAPQGAGPVVPSFGDGGGPSGFGASIREAAVAVRRADEALAATKADQMVLQGSIAAESAVEQSGDWRGWDGTYSKHMEKVLDEASALIPMYSRSCATFSVASVAAA